MELNQIGHDKITFVLSPGFNPAQKNQFGFLSYRLFAFWDKTGEKATVVISTHGLIKKTDKTPVADLEKAERLRQFYFEQKSDIL